MIVGRLDGSIVGHGPGTRVDREMPIQPRLPFEQRRGAQHGRLGLWRADDLETDRPADAVEAAGYADVRTRRPRHAGPDDRHGESGRGQWRGRGCREGYT